MDERIPRAAENLPPRSPILETRVRRLSQELLGLLGRMPDSEVGGDDRSRARSGAADPAPAPPILELAQRADERDPLDASSLKDAIGAVVKDACGLLAVHGLFHVP